jgi:protein Tex
MAELDSISHVAQELKLPIASVRAVAQLLDEKATVPFIARYRKEATGGLDEVQIRSIDERRTYFMELADRRAAIIASIQEQGKLTPSLLAALNACTQKTALEDLYLPFKQKRRTRAQIAIERGLLPLAERILAQSKAPLDAAAFVSPEKEVPDVDAALKGARDIVAERVAEDAEIRTRVREVFLDSGVVSVAVTKEKAKERTKFEQYYDFEERIRDIPSHRFLAIRRGENEGVLKVRLVVDDERLLARIGEKMKVDARSPWAGQLREAIEDGYHRLLIPSITTDVRAMLKERSDNDAATIFAENLSSLLLQAPFGARSVVGIDPGVRTGCKTVFVDDNGAFVENITLHLSQGERALEEARKLLVAFVKKHKPAAVAIGNGTFSRETESFVRKTLSDANLKDIIVVSVNEAGASVYSASDVARAEHPDLDVTVRGAISIARRLQDPLAELVKIDPQSIGVGQYQHDVHQPLLVKKLDDVVESCVNQVGVELNTASPSLLARVAGIGPKLASNIVKHREKKGAFKSRKALLDVTGLGPRAFEQCAGFLRVRGGAHPLDASAVHPERYELVERIAKDVGVPLSSLVGNASAATTIPLSRYVDKDVGLPTLQDIVAELKKPGRDPRATFEPPKFRDDVATIEDLKIGMELQGIVTNVTAFGAFVDVGVHHDGLVHVSQLSDSFVKNPADVVKTGDRINVRVLEIDLVRKRISLSAKRERSAASPPRKPEPKFANNPFAQLKK